MAKTFEKTEIGRVCKNIRLLNNLRQVDIAERVGTKLGNIIAFENGRSSNMMILIEYLNIGLTIEDIRRALWQKQDTQSVN